MAPLAVPWFGRDVVLEGRALFFALLILLILVYIGLRALVNSRFGLVLVAIRENQVRAEMLGYDVRAYQLGVFVIGAILAAMSGVFYVSWGQYITPESMGLTAAILPVIWVAVGGRKDVTATLIGDRDDPLPLADAGSLRKPIRSRGSRLSSARRSHDCAGGFRCRLREPRSASFTFAKSAFLVSAPRPLELEKM